MNVNVLPPSYDRDMTTEPEYAPVYCPVCGAECSSVYLVQGEIVGCEWCLEERDAWEVLNG